MKILGTIVTFNKVLRNNFWYYPPTKIAKNKPVYTCLTPLPFVVASNFFSGTLLNDSHLTIVAPSQAQPVGYLSTGGSEGVSGTPYRHL